MRFEGTKNHKKTLYKFINSFIKTYHRLLKKNNQTKNNRMCFKKKVYIAIT